MACRMRYLNDKCMSDVYVIIEKENSLYYRVCKHCGSSGRMFDVPDHIPKEQRLKYVGAIAEKENHTF